MTAMGLLLAGCDERPAHPEDPTALGDPEEWTGFGRTEGEQHYSPLTQIDTDSVGDLALAWHFDLEPGYSASSPVAAAGMLFVTTGHSHIRAFEAASGRLAWEYDGGTRERARIPLHFSWGNKGLAYAQGRLVLATTDGFVVALDAKSGREIWKTRDFGPDEQRNMNGAPRIFGDKVIVGHGGADVSAIRGWVSAYDLASGKLAWRFHTVPGDPSQPAESRAMEIAAPTWKGDWYGKGGGGTAWNAFSYDPALNLVYIGVGNGFPYAHRKRSPGGGDNLFLASIVAVDAETGAYRWHYQVCPAEQWDCTATQDMTLATVEIGGKTRKVLMQAPKNGFFYVLDRETGELISAEKIAKVTWASRIGKDGRPVENPQVARYENVKGMVEMWPGPTGAHNWLPQAYSPRTGLVYIPVIEQGALIGSGDSGGELGLGIGVNMLPEVDLEDPLNRTSYLKAWDPVAQKAAWTVDLPGSWPGGVMATAGDLVFQGRVDRKLVAYDARSGEEVWSWPTSAPIVAPPITYALDGVQYVTVITGMGGNGAGVMSLGNADYRTDYTLQRQVLTFALGGKDAYVPAKPPKRMLPQDPGFTADPKTAERGAILYGITGCLACHGYNAVGGGAAPDLRYSPLILDGDSFAMVVSQGALRANGMPPFPRLGKAEVEAIRHYLRARSHQVPAEAAQRKAAAARKAASGGAPPAAYAGTWDITIATPLGDQDAVLVLAAEGAALTGRVTSDQGDMNVTGRVAKGRAHFAGKATKPMEMDVSYDVLVKGAKMEGETRSGPFGTFGLTGKKRN
ncbi:PQQ-binding-like beta-propeller repeat protein [Novosphingobium sp. YJ-S2-02]|uniref:PQQ-binding-like beta-propeller repeat protein n=2 Tax=Novosphingobium aureum TaxID=2792964 RepID=A0A931HEK5_9SPHN|nr:PQQ-binding-like beta-propeller repeat protein [Novosphingobium aureum]